MMKREQQEIGSRIFLLRLKGQSISHCCRVLDVPEADYIPCLFAFLQAPVFVQADMLKRAGFYSKMSKTTGEKGFITK